jgi:hypothetical protein
MLSRQSAGKRAALFPSAAELQFEAIDMSGNESSRASVYKSIGISLSILLFLSACATLPPRRTPAETVQFLPAGGMLYFFLDPSTDYQTLWESILEKISPAEDGHDLSPLLERTESIYGSVGTGEEGKRYLYTVFTGRFPSSLIGLNLGKENDWMKIKVAPRERRTPRSYWSSAETGMEISLPDRNLIFISNGDILSLLRLYGGESGPSEPARLSAPVLRDMMAAGFSAYFPDFQNALISNVVGKKLPVRDLLLGVYRESDAYLIRAVFTLNSEESMRVFNMALRFALIYLLKETGMEGAVQKLGALEIEQDGLKLTVRGLAFTEAELAMFLEYFLKAGR